MEIVTRDRSADYARAISTGAPHAVQVADRFHLAKNAGEALERVVQRNHQGLRLAAKAVDQERAQQTPSATDEVQPPQPRLHPQPMTERSTHGSPARQRRLARYQEVTALAAEGLGPKAIAQRVGLTRQTVAIWLRAGRFPKRPPAKLRRMLITPYEPYLRERWQVGEQNSRQLWREIQTQGFRGGQETVRRLVVQWHTERGRSGPPRKHQSTAPIVGHAPPLPVCWPASHAPDKSCIRSRSRKGGFQMLSRPRWPARPSRQAWQPGSQGRIQSLDRRGVDATQFNLRPLHHIFLEQMLTLAQDFAALLRERRGDELDTWLGRAQSSGITALRRFAASLRQDYAAVKAAAVLPYSRPDRGQYQSS